MNGVSLRMFHSEDVFERVRRIPIEFNRYGMDRYGISQEHLTTIFSLLKPIYRYYFRVTTHGMENIPDDGVMLVGNHSGGVPVDGAMVLAASFFELEPPRLAHGMVDKFANRWPVVSKWFSRMGQFTGLPEHAVRLLREGRMLMVYPEGTEGIGKLYRDRYQLVDFGTGFMRIALEADVPIVPFAFIGGEEAHPTMFHLDSLAKLLGAPYIPVPPHLLPIPLPVHCEIHFGEPMQFDGTGAEADETILSYIDQVKTRIAELIDEGRRHRDRYLEQKDDDPIDGESLIQEAETVIEDDVEPSAESGEGASDL